MSNAEILTRKEVAHYLRVSLPTVDRLIQSGALRGTNVGRRKIFLMEDIHAYLTSRRDGTPGFDVATRGVVVKEFLAYYEAVETLNKSQETHRERLAAAGVDVEFVNTAPAALMGTSVAIAKEVKSRVLDEFTDWAIAINLGAWQDALKLESKLNQSNVKVAFVGAGKQG